MLLEYEFGSDIFSIQNINEYNKIIDSCLIMSQLYNEIVINIAII